MSELQERFNRWVEDNIDDYVDFSPKEAAYSFDARRFCKDVLDDFSRDDARAALHNYMVEKGIIKISS